MVQSQMNQLELLRTLIVVMINSTHGCLAQRENVVLLHTFSQVFMTKIAQNTEAKLTVMATPLVIAACEVPTAIYGVTSSNTSITP